MTVYCASIPHKDKVKGMGNQLNKQFYAFALLTLLVMVELDHLSRQTAVAQVIGSFLVVLTMVLYVVSIHEFEHTE